MDAVKERNRSDGRITVRTAIADNGRALVSVSDNGVGIDEDLMEQVLEPFFTTKVRGVGLGLPAVMKIMAHHQGGFALDEGTDGGTRATLWLPVTVSAMNQ